MTYPVVIDVLNEALDELLAPEVTTLVNATDDNGRFLRALVNRQGRALTNDNDQGWTVLQKLHTFSTANGTAEYDLPSDYDRLLNDTIWNRTLVSPLNGPLTPAMWQTIKSGLIGAGAYSQRFRIVKSASALTRKFTIDPTPTAVETVAFEYASNGWCCLADQSAASNSLQNDTDLLVLDKDLMIMGLIWRWKRAKGFEFTTALGEYNEALDSNVANDTPAYVLSMAPNSASYRLIGYANIPESDFG